MSTAQELIEKYGGGWKEDRENAEIIREEAIKNGTWRKSVSETIETETVATEMEMSTAVVNDNSIILPCLMGVGIGFSLGVLLMIAYFRKRIVKIKSEAEIKVNEARTALDRVARLAIERVDF